jgi:hypothetical protein
MPMLNVPEITVTLILRNHFEIVEDDLCLREQDNFM